MNILSFIFYFLNYDFISCFIILLNYLCTKIVDNFISNIEIALGELQFFISRLFVNVANIKVMEVLLLIFEGSSIDVILNFFTEMRV
jgi:hypothetical protein